MRDQHHDDFAFEPVPGLPAHLPSGEAMLWQGTPEPIAFAIEVMRLRLAAVLVAALVIWRTASSIHDGALVGAVFVVAGGTLIGGLIAVGLLAVSGWLMARGTIYTITSQRLIIRHGVAMPMAINIPFSKVASAAAADGILGSTSIALTLLPKARSSIIALWPHARPWTLIRPEPSLRAIADGAHVAELLAHTLTRVAGQPIVAPAPSAPRDSAGLGAVVPMGAA
jgi:hypothetical protein